MSAYPNTVVVNMSATELLKHRQQMQKQLNAKVSEKVRSASEVRKTWGDEGDQELEDAQARVLSLLRAYHQALLTSRRNQLISDLWRLRYNSKLNWNDPYCAPLHPVKLPELPPGLKQDDYRAMLESAFGAGSVRQIEPSAAGLLPFGYGPQSVTPSDKGMFYLVLAMPPPGSAEERVDLLKYVHDHVVLDPMYYFMLQKAVKLRARQPPKSLAFFAEAVKAVNEAGILDRLDALPKRVKDETLNGGKPYFPIERIPTNTNPGYPFNCTPVDAKGTKTFSTVEQVFEMALEVVNRIWDHLGKKAYMAQLPADLDRHTWFCMQAGNNKPVTVAESASGKPDRAIYSSPLALRIIDAIFAVPFYRNWHSRHADKGWKPCQGFVMEWLVTLVTEAVGGDVEVEFFDPPAEYDGEKLVYVPAVKFVRFKGVVFRFPDIRGFDLTQLALYCDAFGEQVKKMLPHPKTEPEEAHKRKLEKLLDFSLYRQSHFIQCVVNNNMVVSAKDLNPSGSRWTFERNTYTNEVVITQNQMSAAKTLGFTGAFDERRHFAYRCYGDDSIQARASSDVPHDKYFAAYDKKFQANTGMQQKEETLKIYDSPSYGLYLGRRIVAVAFGKVRAMVAILPERLLAMTLARPKHNVKATKMSADQFLLLRVLACAIEGDLFYPDLARATRLAFRELSAKHVTLPDVDFLANVRGLPIDVPREAEKEYLALIHKARVTARYPDTTELVQFWTGLAVGPDDLGFQDVPETPETETEEYEESFDNAKEESLRTGVREKDQAEASPTDDDDEVEYEEELASAN